jgi:hypothetical protein
MVRQTQTFLEKSINIFCINKVNFYSKLLLEVDYDFEIKRVQKKYIDAVDTVHSTNKTTFFIMYADIFCIIEKQVTRNNEMQIHDKFHINFEIFDTCQYNEMNQKYYFILDSQLYIWDINFSSIIFKIKISQIFPQKYGKFLLNKVQMTLTCFPELLPYSEKKSKKRYLIIISLKRFVIIQKHLFYIPSNVGLEELSYDYSNIIDYYNSFHMEENVFFRCKNKIYQIAESVLNFEQYNAIIPPLMFLKQHISKLFRIKEAFIDEIESYCQFIYMHLNETNKIDYNFKSLNPLILLIYFNKPYILRSVLESYGLCFIPTYSYFGIFEFCLRLQRKECLREIKNYILKKEGHSFRLNYQDYHALLRSDDKDNHFLLSLVFQNEKDSITPNFLYMESNVDVKQYKDVSVLTLEENKILNAKNVINEKRQKHIFKSYSFNSETEQQSGNFVQNVSLPFDMDFSLGSLESIHLSHYFSISPSDDFIDSDFKYLIQKKWNSLRIAHYIKSFVYILFILFFILASIFFPENFPLRILNTSFIWIIIFIEILELISSSCYNILL